MHKQSLVGRHYRNLAMAIGASLLLVLVISRKDRAGHPQKELPFYPQKRQRQSPLVCSHQVLNPPRFLPGQEGLYTRSVAIEDSPRLPKEGSLDAMTALWYNGGVPCFDVDVVVLSDGSMMASHPRRLKAAIQDRRKEDGPNHKEIVLEEFTLDSMYHALGIQRQNVRIGSNDNVDAASSFPLFDTELLPHFAKMVRGIPGAFSTNNHPSTHSLLSPRTPWDLKGPLLYIDLKQGPYLTEDRVLKLAKQIHDLGLEDYVAVCVAPPPPQPPIKDNESAIGSSLDLLDVLHRYNTHTAPQTIPLGLVLRDLVAEDADVDRIRQVVEVLYPESIKALIPSNNFSKEWYQTIRNPESSSQNQRDSKTKLWRLPMTVWTIDSKEDYRFVSSITTTSKGVGGNGKNINALSIPIASAVVANRPIEIIQ